MGIDQRVPFSIEGIDVTEPRDRAVNDFLTQPPIGCQYLDSPGDTVTVANTTFTFDIRAPGVASPGVTYDPYNMIDPVNDRIKIPFPGVWDVQAHWLAYSPSVALHFYCQLTQGNVGINNTTALFDMEYMEAECHMQFNEPLYVDRAWIASKTYLYPKGQSISGTARARLMSFSLWLRSAQKPGKY